MIDAGEDEEHNTYENKVEVDVVEGHAHTHISTIRADEDGNLLSREDDEIDAVKGDDELIHEHERDVRTEEGQTIERTDDRIEDERGEVLLEKVEERDSEGKVHIHKTTRVQIGDEEVTVEHDTQIDAEGNVVHEEVERQVVSERDGEVVVTETKEVVDVEEVEEGEREEKESEIVSRIVDGN